MCIRDRLRTPRGEEAQSRRPGTGVHQTLVGEDGEDLLGAFLRRRHQGHVIPDHVGDHPRQERIVRAPENQGVDPGLAQRQQVATGRVQQLLSLIHI